MTSYYCETCNKFVTNKWARINGYHVGCPEATNRTRIQVAEPNAGQQYYLNEDNEFVCDHLLSLNDERVECEYGCEVPEHIAQPFTDDHYECLAMGGW